MKHGLSLTFERADRSQECSTPSRVRSLLQVSIKQRRKKEKRPIRAVDNLCMHVWGSSNYLLPCGPGNPLSGQPYGCPLTPSSVYSCSIPNQGWLFLIKSMTFLQVYLRLVSGKERASFVRPSALTPWDQPPSSTSNSVKHSRLSLNWRGFGWCKKSLWAILRAVLQLISHPCLYSASNAFQVTNNP